VIRDVLACLRVVLFLAIPAALWLLVVAWMEGWALPAAAQYGALVGIAVALLLIWSLLVAWWDWLTRRR